VDSNDNDNCDENDNEEVNDDDIIQEALRIAWELKAQKEQLIKRRKVSEGKPAEMAKRDGPTVNHFGLAYIVN
jgi:hypothetical protein